MSKPITIELTEQEVLDIIFWYDTTDAALQTEPKDDRLLNKITSNYHSWLKEREITGD